MKKIIYLGFVFFLFVNDVFAFSARDSSVKDGILNWNTSNENIFNITSSGKQQLTDLLNIVISQLKIILPLIIIGSLLFVGYKILVAKGNPEEFKKAFKLLIYIVVGIFVISISRLLVSFISVFKF